MTIPNTTHRLLVERLGGTDPSVFIGNEGEVFFDPNTPALKLSDGSTPGGVSIGGTGIGTSFDQDLNTTNDVTFNRLGLTGGEISVGYNNSLLINVDDAESGASTYTFDTVGNLTLPGNIYIDGNSGYVLFNNGGSKIQAEPTNDFEIHVGGFNNKVTGFGTDGSLTVPGTITLANGLKLADSGSGLPGNFGFIGDETTDVLYLQGQNGVVLAFPDGLNEPYSFNFDVSGMTFPDGTVATGSSITTPNGGGVGAANTFTINAWSGFLPGPSGGSYGSFSVDSSSIKLPSANGLIKVADSYWYLDPVNTEFKFPNNDSIRYNITPDYGYGVNWGLTLYTQEQPISIVAAQDKRWGFNTDGSLTTPGDIIVSSGSSIGIGSEQPTASLDVQGGDIKVGVNTSTGVILTDENGVAWRLHVNTDGTLGTTFV